MNNIPSDFPLRWSAGSSILAFLPTMVGLMSNSITEIITVAETSTVLAIMLCFCSVTSFSSRLTHELKNEIYIGHNPPAEHLQAAWEDMKGMITGQGNRKTHWWNGTKVRDAALGLVLTALSGGVWYEVYQLSRYGVFTFACPVKITIGIWVGLSQIIALLNFSWRFHLYDVRRIQLHSTIRQPASRLPLSASSNESFKRTVIILRSRRSSLVGDVLRSITAIISYALFCFGTVILASINFVPASDAIRALVVLSASAGFGRLICYWTISPSRKKNVYVFEVPPKPTGGLGSIRYGSSGSHPMMYFIISLDLNQVFG
ncbi:hypothetical protein MMC29_005785 [Sticta canariensis]|nr:hypothetical protein [Sticta canariensis]